MLKWTFKKKQLLNMNTAVSDVKGSYPAPPDAKHTPVANSPGSTFGSKYAGSNSLMPNSSTDSTIQNPKK